MKQHILIACQQCQQQIRMPANLGGMLMQCPHCGHTFHSDFKLASSRTQAEAGQPRPARGGSILRIVV